MSPRAQVVLAACLLVASLVLWPVSMVTFAAEEQPVTLSLSWLAISFTALDFLKTSLVDLHQQDEDDE